MRVGLGLLRLSSSAFWAMTPIEFERAAGAAIPKQGTPLRRGDLTALMQAFPDIASKETGFG